MTRISETTIEYVWEDGQRQTVRMVDQVVDDFWSKVEVGPELRLHLDESGRAELTEGEE